MIDKTCKFSEYQTPPRILDPVREYFGGAIDLDPATAPDNPTGAKLFYTPETNGLIHSWNGKVFVNPPYGPEIKDFAAKLFRETCGIGRAHVVALLPGNRFEQQYWQDYIWNEQLTGFCLVRKRLSFIVPGEEKKKGNPYSSFLYLYNGHWAKFVSAFHEVGKCIRIGYS